MNVKSEEKSRQQYSSIYEEREPLVPRGALVDCEMTVEDKEATWPSSGRQLQRAARRGKQTAKWAFIFN